MTDTSKDFFRWTRDKQGAFSKNLKQELDKKLPIEGGTLSGPIFFDRVTETLGDEDVIKLRIRYKENTFSCNWSMRFIPYSPISYICYDNSKLVGICHNLGIFPNNPNNRNFTLGYYGSKWPNVYTKRINNGGDIEIPEKAGTMALLSDIEDILRKYNLIPQQEPEVPDDGTQE